MRIELCRTAALCAAILRLAPPVVAPRTPPLESAINAANAHLFGADDAAARAIDTSGMEDELWRIMQGVPTDADSHYGYHQGNPSVDHGYGGYQAAPDDQHGYQYADYGAYHDPHAGHYAYGGQSADRGTESGSSAELHQSAPGIYLDQSQGVARKAGRASNSGPAKMSRSRSSKAASSRPVIPSVVIKDPLFEESHVNAALLKYRERYLLHYKTQLLSQTSDGFQGWIDLIHFVPRRDLKFPEHLGSTFVAARAMYMSKGRVRMVALDHPFGLLEEPLYLQDYLVNALIDPMRPEQEGFYFASVAAHHHGFATRDEEADEFRRFYLGELRIPTVLAHAFAKQ
ncbi:uncharacterized protein PFL1_02762 [Pseudozyma flocculosa PF-1]|uniref:HNH nuclease domain-containing protein n=1 Tax=Pseudozyma flocculosa PF-1 TaxID=1277687 RepID=A0A061HAC3_9BASI|nr:uncharacterized protein PFL1_02762 [Pseudozyma flocculosa PF-1]EPQ29543.1 hypothetical protein PFL1_02762 [Pseudozyma flocculosa PF-1]